MSVRKGTYVLFLTFSEPFEGDVGRLGRIYLEPGTYCYVGSAMGGLDQRISRICPRARGSDGISTV